MAGWGDEDTRPTVQGPSPRRLHSRHVVFVGMLLLAVGALVNALGGRVLGPMLLVLGVFILTFGALGWVLERFLGWDVDDPASGSMRLHDLSRLPTRIRKR